MLPLIQSPQMHSAQEADLTVIADCSRYQSYQWPYSSRQGMSEWSPDLSQRTNHRLTDIRNRTARNYTTSPPRSGVPALAQPQTPSSPPPSSVPMSSCTRYRRAVTRE